MDFVEVWQKRYNTSDKNVKLLRLCLEIMPNPKTLDDFTVNLVYMCGELYKQYKKLEKMIIKKHLLKIESEILKFEINKFKKAKRYVILNKKWFFKEDTKCVASSKKCGFLKFWIYKCLLQYNSIKYEYVSKKINKMVQKVKLPERVADKEMFKKTADYVVLLCNPEILKEIEEIKNLNHRIEMRKNCKKFLKKGTHNATNNTNSGK